MPTTSRAVLIPKFIPLSHTIRMILCISAHLIEAWCRVIGIHYNGELPKLYLSHNEYTEFGKAFMWDRPIFLVQISGGPLEAALGYAWPRDMPIEIAQEVINRLMKDYYVVQIRHEK